MVQYKHPLMSIKQTTKVIYGSHSFISSKDDTTVVFNNKEIRNGCLPPVPKGYTKFQKERLKVLLADLSVEKLKQIKDKDKPSENLTREQIIQRELEAYNKRLAEFIHSFKRT
jgi:hypothetical protein